MVIDDRQIGSERERRTRNRNREPSTSKGERQSTHAGRRLDSIDTASRSLTARSFCRPWQAWGIEPSFVAGTVEYAAEQWGLPLDEAAASFASNFRDCFGVEP